MSVISQKEENIINGCLKGNTLAQKELFFLYAPYMLGISRRYIDSIDEAKDVVQLGFIKIFENLHKFDKRSKLKTWMTRIVINTAIDKLKVSKKIQFVSSDNMNEYENYSEDDDYEEESGLTKEILLEMIDNLPTGYKMVFNMYAIDGLTHKEISEKLGISEGTSKSQLLRARKFLKNQISDYRNQNVI